MPAFKVARITRKSKFLTQLSVISKFIFEAQHNKRSRIDFRTELMLNKKACENTTNYKFIKATSSGLPNQFSNTPRKKDENPSHKKKTKRIQVANIQLWSQ